MKHLPEGDWWRLIFAGLIFNWVKIHGFHSFFVKSGKTVSAEIAENKPKGIFFRGFLARFLTLLIANKGELH